VRNLADHLALGEDVPEEWLEAVPAARERLVEMHSRYSEDDAVSALMAEALRLFDSALDRLERREDLALAVVEAEEADDVLALVEYEVGLEQEAGEAV